MTGTVAYTCPTCRRAAEVEYEGVEPTAEELDDLAACPACYPDWNPLDTRRPSFADWLVQYRRHQTAVGDLARDVATDPDWPASSSHGRLRDYLLLKAEASDRCLETFERAWRAWHTERTLDELVEERPNDQGLEVTR